MPTPTPTPKILTPRFPVYIPSKGRFTRETALTALSMAREGLPFRLVVEPPERERYEAVFGPERVLVLPFHDLGLGSIPARNWIWEHARSTGAARHWCIDDNIRGCRRSYKGLRVGCSWALALSACEILTDQYANVGLSGLAYDFFVFPSSKSTGTPPVYVNSHVYSCILIDTSLPNRWRGRYNEDTDLCLQILTDGLCTILVNAFCVKKVATMTVKGGNSAELYRGDGRLQMSRELERRWPGIVSTRHRFNRPQHVIRNQWRGFDTKLIRRDPDRPIPNIDSMITAIVNPALPLTPGVAAAIDHWRASGNAVDDSSGRTDRT